MVSERGFWVWAFGRDGEGWGVLLKGSKGFAGAPRCAFRLRMRDRMIFDFDKSKTSAAHAGRSRLTAPRFAPRISGGRAVCCAARLSENIGDIF